MDEEDVPEKLPADERPPSLVAAEWEEISSPVGSEDISIAGAVLVWSTESPPAATSKSPSSPKPPKELLRDD